jgi:hypothetical protein
VVLPKPGGIALSVLVASLLERASRPLRLSVLGLEGSGVVRRRLAERFPELAFDWIPVEDLDAASARLLLPDLLTDASRVIVPALPAVATGDVAELADLDLGEHGIAAPTRPDRTRMSGFGLIYGAARRLGDRTEQASALRRGAHARHSFDFDAYSTHVLVLDLDRLRQEGTGRQALALMDAYGLDDIEALHYVVGPARAALPPCWATVPTRMPVRGPGLLHWADRVKPWHDAPTPERDAWRRYAARFKARAAG